ncbi:hypothetical protein acsn021_43790 [Anaerocolumna cellulosilytica]|uniref:Uncharacterized protein n=1 Tax=Anaerocolumna cellulosilytica TaxID=433286 RepID=A0A6S6RBD5_9FIRM|nr:hypothetical protein [Anaerocolumna cellulosilytica]MBB5198121.1 hypothetical protein [Anaerocolumna cellulosilytica]BCJ96810.1 hypothetical protein acsn021_43790 [Anaerocolumna cellulosilytica]
MTICPKCKKIYKRNRPHICNCDRKNQPMTIEIRYELVGVVVKLLERGFKVVFASCDTYPIYADNPQIKSTTIMVELGDLYPEAMLEGLPPDWMQYEYHRVANDIISEYKYTGLSCTEYHPVGESDEGSIDFTKMIMLSNLESWLDDRAPESFYAVWRLAGVLM